MSAIVPVYDHPVEVRDFVERGLWDGNRQFGPCTAIGFANAAEGLVAGVVYHNYEPDNGVIEMSSYSSRRDWCSRGHLKSIFNYPFVQMKLRLALARHSEHNHRVARIWKAFGAKQYVIPDLRADGEAEVISVLSQGDWMKSKFMKGQPNACEV